MSDCNHTILESCLSSDECAACLRERAQSSFAATAGCAALVGESISVLTDVAQLLDGWHSDGTSWSEWDESVRQRVSTLQQKLYALKQHNGLHERPGATTKKETNAK